MKYRLYQEMRPCGTLKVSNNYRSVELTFGIENKLYKKYVKLINKFLKENNVKPINATYSFKKHYNRNKPITTKLFETYSVKNDPRRPGLKVLEKIKYKTTHNNTGEKRGVKR